MGANNVVNDSANSNRSRYNKGFLHTACGLGRDDKVEYWGSDRLEGQPVRILSGKGNTLSFCILNSELENND